MHLEAKCQDPTKGDAIAGAAQVGISYLSKIGGQSNSAGSIFDQLACFFATTLIVHSWLSEGFRGGTFSAEMQSYNERLIASASTRQYESATLPARQMHQLVPDAP